MASIRKRGNSYQVTVSNGWRADGSQIIETATFTPDPADRLPDIPLHGLRHISVTLLISQHVDVRTVSGRLGRAQASTTTDIYSHFLKQADMAAADTLDHLFQAK